eukprot:m.168756 g.168756  ORF g.168756 m.168756 type:complete len:195 (+) comp15322_c0_seq3:1949-2533(+)
MMQLYNVNFSTSDARTAAEEQIFLALKQQMDEILPLVEYDWAPLEPRAEPDDQIFHLLAYLSTVFGTLSNMPLDVARAAYFETCKYVAAQLTGFVSDPETKKVNPNGIKNFQIDVEACEQYAANSPESIADCKDLFAGAFTPLQQLVTLFCNWDWSAFLNPKHRAAQYGHVDPLIALHLLERLMVHEYLMKFLP